MAHTMVDSTTQADFGKGSLFSRDHNRVITIRCTRSRGPRGLFCLQDVCRGPVNVDVIMANQLHPMPLSMPKLTGFAIALLLALTSLGCSDNGTNIAEDKGILVESGMKIDVVAAAMASGGFRENMRGVSSFNPSVGLKLWAVDTGTLMVSYRKSDTIVTDMEFNVATDAPEMPRQTLTLKVLRFCPESGEMTTQISK